MNTPEDAVTDPTTPTTPSASTESTESPIVLIVPTEKIGWLRALATGLVIVVVGFIGAVWGPNEILTKSLALTRTAREWLAIGVFFVTIVVMATALRWLQHRKMI
jgi:hypothetical protein